MAIIVLQHTTTVLEVTLNSAIMEDCALTWWETLLAHVLLDSLEAPAECRVRVKPVSMACKNHLAKVKKWLHPSFGGSIACTHFSPTNVSNKISNFSEYC